jgi:hypothetical protein
MILIGETDKNRIEVTIDRKPIGDNEYYIYERQKCVNWKEFWTNLHRDKQERILEQTFNIG